MLSPKTFDQYIDKIVDYIKKNPPTCNDEFKLYTKYFYGIELKCNWKCYINFEGQNFANGNYEIEELERQYSKVPLYRCWEKKFGWYDGLKVLLNETFGKLYCGGVAGSHYGQVEISKEKAMSLLDWDVPMETLRYYLKEIEILKVIDGIKKA